MVEPGEDRARPLAKEWNVRSDRDIPKNSGFQIFENKALDKKLKSICRGCEATALPLLGPWGGPSRAEALQQPRAAWHFGAMVLD